MIPSVSKWLRGALPILLLASLCIQTVAAQLPAVRPSIADVPALEMSGTPSFWPTHLQAAALMTGMILEVYQEQEIYFLARDAGILYDLAQLATEREPKVRGRLHFLWVSRMTYDNPHLHEYLAQEGISEGHLKTGQSYVFVDLGYEGTFPCLLREQWPEFSDELKIQLMTSTGGPLCRERHISSSRSAMTAILGDHGFEMGRSAVKELMKLESLPQHSDPAANYVFENGRWQVSTLSPAWDESFRAPGIAASFMSDLKYRFQSGELRESVEKARSTWRRLMNPTRAGDRTRVLGELRKMLDSDDLYQKAVAIDYIQAMKLNFRNELKMDPIRFAEVGLEDLHRPYKWAADPSVLFSEYPELRVSFEELFREGSTDQERQSLFFGLLRQNQQELIRKFFVLIDNPAEIIFPLARALYQWMNQSGETEFLREMIQLEHRSLNQAILTSVLAQTHPGEYPSIFFDMISSAIDGQRIQLAEIILAKLNRAEATPFLEELRASFKDARNLRDFERLLDRHQPLLCPDLFR